MKTRELMDLGSFLLVTLLVWIFKDMAATSNKAELSQLFLPLGYQDEQQLPLGTGLTRAERSGGSRAARKEAAPPHSGAEGRGRGRRRPRPRREGVEHARRGRHGRRSRPLSRSRLGRPAPRSPRAPPH